MTELQGLIHYAHARTHTREIQKKKKRFFGKLLLKENYVDQSSM